MAAPTRVSYNTPASGNYSTSTTPKTTASFDVQSGDIVVVIGSCEDSGSTLGTPSASGGSITWTLRQSVVVSNYSSIYVWTGAVGATASGITVSVTKGGGEAHWWGFSATVWRNHGGVGASNKANTTGAPSLSLTTTGANSAIQIGSNDWNAVSGTSRTWRSVNGSAATESTYFTNATHHTAYGGYHGDAGAGGSKTVGLSAPSGQKYSIVAVEVKAGEDAGPTVYAAAGTAASASSAAGSASRVKRVFSAAGTAASASAAQGAATRVSKVFGAAGTAASTSTASGAATRVLRSLSAAGTAASTSAATGNATRVLRTFTAAGTAASSSTAVGDATLIQSNVPNDMASGAAASTSTAVGTVTALRVAAGTTASSSNATGATTRILAASGTTASRSAAEGSASGGAADFYLFRPPTRRVRVAGVGDPLFGRMWHDVGYAVLLRTDGSFEMTEFVDPDRTDVEKAYTGGRVNRVTAEEGDALTEAGYGEYLTPVFN